MPVVIYALVDPNTNRIRYIGKSINPVSRYKSHLTEKGSTRKCRWVHRLLKQGKRPILIQLEVLSGIAHWEAVEQYWIRLYKNLGHDLCNHTIGGDGLQGMDEATKRKISQIRIAYALENRDKILLVARAPERIAKISRANKGKSKSPEHLSKIRALPQNQKGYDKSHLTSEQRAKHAHKGNQFAKGSKRTPEQIEAQRCRQTGVKRKHVKPQSLESNLKRSITLKGRSKSPEWIEKIRQGSLKRWKDPEQKRMQSERVKAQHKARSKNQNRKGDFHEVRKSIEADRSADGAS